MDLKSIVRMAKDLDRKGFFKQADRITTAFMKKEAIFYLQALMDTTTLNALVNAIYNFYNKRDVDAVIDENGLKNSDESAFMKYDTSDIRWQHVFEDLSSYYKPMKSLDEKVVIKATLPNDNPIPIDGKAVNFQELKNEIMALCGQIEKTRSKLPELKKQLQNTSDELSSLQTKQTIRDMEKSQEPISYE